MRPYTRDQADEFKQAIYGHDPVCVEGVEMLRRLAAAGISVTFPRYRAEKDGDSWDVIDNTENHDLAVATFWTSQDPAAESHAREHADRLNGEVTS